MTRSQRLLSLIVAAAIAVGALVLLSGGEDPTDTASTPTASETVTRPPAEARPTPTATPIQAEAEPREDATATPTPAPREAVTRPQAEAGATPRPQPPLLTAGQPRTLRFEEGETIAFRVRSDAPEEVHVHGYDRYVDIPAGRTRTVRFDASLTGIFEVELHGSGAEIGRLRVEPR